MDGVVLWKIGEVSNQADRDTLHHPPTVPYSFALPTVVVPLNFILEIQAVLDGARTLFVINIASL